MRHNDMTIAFYPRRLLLTAVFLVAFGAALSFATDARRGLAVGAVAVMAYGAIELWIFINPAACWRRERHEQRG
jgi:hypothetical protein